MHSFKLELLATVAAWAATSTGHSIVTRDGQTVSANQVDQLGCKLSAKAKIFLPGSPDFANSSARWSVLGAPTVNVVVVPGNANDVAETVKFANKFDLPFLTYNGGHGATTTLGRMSTGIEIDMAQLSSVQISKDGKTAKIGGGTNAKVLVDTLWAAGKQAVTGTCECVSYFGPALGGGHGWLQGHHGLVADQILSLDVVLADGTLKTFDANSDLFWALKGAGHNFGIVTSSTTKIYDIQHSDWAIETIIFSGTKVEAVYEAANKYILQNGKQPDDLINWSYWLNIPAIDPKNPIIIMYIIQEGVTAVDTKYTKPFHDIGPVSIQPISGTYLDLAAWTGIDLSAAPCQKFGTANPRWPIYLQSYNIAATKKAYSVYAAAVGGSSVFNNSLLMFEGYSMNGVHSIDPKSSAFAFRSENLLAAPLIIYEDTGSDIVNKAYKLGAGLREILRQGSGEKNLRAYINYAYGDETDEQIYGAEPWRLERLRALKKKYDPKGKFSFYAPITL